MRVMQHGARHAAEHEAADAAQTPGAADHQARVELVGDLHDRTPGRRPGHGQPGLGVPPVLASQAGALLGGGPRRRLLLAVELRLVVDRPATAKAWLAMRRATVSHTVSTMAGPGRSWRAAAPSAAREPSEPSKQNSVGPPHSVITRS